MVTDFGNMTASETLLYTGACAIIIAYEFVLGVVRVQDYFQAYYARCVQFSIKNLFIFVH